MRKIVMLGLILLLVGGLVLSSGVHGTTYSYVPAGINISWNVVQNATHYSVSRSTDNVTYLFLGNVTSTSYTDYPDSSNFYYYKIEAINATNATISTWYVSVKFYPPAKPEGFAAVYTTNKIHLSWSSMPGATEYTIYRGEEPGKEVKYVSLTATNYTDTDVLSGHTYYYYIVAYNSTGISAPSVELKVEPSSGAGYITVSGVTFNSYILAAGVLLFIFAIPITIYGSKKHKDVGIAAFIFSIILIGTSWALAQYAGYPNGVLTLYGVAFNSLMFYAGVAFLAIGVIILLASKAGRKEHEDVGAFLISFGLVAMLVAWLLQYIWG